MKLKWLGVGSAFTTAEYYQTNALITSNSGKHLLIDCGSDIRFSLAEAGLTQNDIDAVYISHLHADHVGGCEWLAFTRYFNPSLPHPRLFTVDGLMEDMWEHSLRGGLESIEGKVMNLTDYFICDPVPINSSFSWENIIFTPIQTVHIMSGYKIVNSYGLMIYVPISSKYIFLTTDTQFCPNQIGKFYDQATVIFHDCETSKFKSGVHSHYDDLKTLDVNTKSKMWLVHYQPNMQPEPIAGEFKGFVVKGQEFEF